MRNFGAYRRLRPETRRPASGTASPVSHVGAGLPPSSRPLRFRWVERWIRCASGVPLLLRDLLVVVVRAGIAVVRGAGGPAGEQAQRVVRGGTGLGGVGEQALARFGGDREGLERELEIPDDRVVDELDAGGVDPDVVGGPPDPELVAAGGQLPDQVRQSPVVGIAAGLGAQQGDGVAGDLVPVAEELGGVRVQEQEPGVVGRPDRVGVDR
jgi:hypothetical protein